MCSSCAIRDEGHPTASVRRRRLNIFAAVLLVAAGAASAGIGLASLLGYRTAPAAAVPKPARTLELHGRDLRSGRSLAATLRGRAVIVEFWSSACPACRRVAKNLQRNATDGRSLALVGIDVGDTRATARVLLRQLGWRYLSDADPHTRLANTVVLRTLPTTLLLDRRHRVVLQITGIHSLATLSKQAERLH